jgi:hypothetical protein
MATVIKLKRGTSTPTTSNITSGEVAVDTSAKKLYINDSGTIKEIGGAGGDLGDLTNVTETDLRNGHYLAYNGSNWRNEFEFNIGKHVPFTLNDGSETSLPLTNSNDVTTPTGLLNNIVSQSYYFPYTLSDGTDVSTMKLGTITNSDLTYSTITVSGDSGSHAIDLGDTLSVTGDTGITTTVSTDAVAIDLDDTAVTPGSYGSSSQIPTFTVDQQGRITSAGSTSFSDTLTIVDDSSTSSSITLGNDTLKVAGASGISSTISGDTLTIALVNSPTFGSSSSDTVTFNARVGSHFVPDTNITYDLGTTSLRWRDLYLSGNTIDLNGATISADGSGTIEISANGATLPEGSKVGSKKLSAVGEDGVSERVVNFFTRSGGLATAATTFIFKDDIDRKFTNFTFSSGQTIGAPVQLFAF